MTPEEALQLIRQGEGQKVEFKQSLAEWNQAIKSLCAFANAEGGTVFFGVSQAGDVLTVSVGAVTLDRFSNNIRAHTQAPLSPTIERLTLEGKEIVAATVPKHARGQLFYAFNVPLVRVGATNQVMTPAEQQARLMEGQEDRSQERDRPGSAVARPLAGPESQGIDALAVGHRIATARDRVGLRTLVTSTRRFLLTEWSSRIEGMSGQPVARTQIPSNEVYAYCLPYVESFAPDIRLVEAFGLALAEAEYAEGLTSMLRVVEDWISMSDKPWPSPSLKAITGAPALLALRVLATWGAKAAEQTSASVLATLLTHPLDTVEWSGQSATLPLVDRRDLFHPHALLDRADLGARYLTEEPWKNSDVAKMFASQQDYLSGLSQFLFLAALLHEARHPDESWPLYPGFKLVQGSSRSIHTLVGRISMRPQLMDSLARMPNEDAETFRSNWPKRARRLNDAGLGDLYFRASSDIPEEI